MPRLVSTLVDRVLREWLESPEEQPTRLVLAGDLAIGASTLTYDPTFLGLEEEDILGPGVLIELGSEQLLAGTVNAGTNQVTGLRRAVNGTTAAAHTSGTVGKVAPTWTRKAVFDALADAVVALYPDLFDVTTHPITLSSTGPTEVPADVAYPLWLWFRPGGTGSSTWGRAAVDFLDEFPGTASTKAVVSPLSDATTGHLVYARRFARPASEATDLEALGVAEEWDRLVSVQAVAYLLAGRELPAVTQEFLTRQLEQQNFPVGSATRVRDGLLRYAEHLTEKARADLRNRYPTTVVRRAVI